MAIAYGSVRASFRPETNTSRFTGFGRLSVVPKQTRPTLGSFRPVVVPANTFESCAIVVSILMFYRSHQQHWMRRLAEAYLSAAALQQSMDNVEFILADARLVSQGGRKPGWKNAVIKSTRGYIEFSGVRSLRSNYPRYANDTLLGGYIQYDPDLLTIWRAHIVSIRQPISAPGARPRLVGLHHLVQDFERRDNGDGTFTTVYQSVRDSPATHGVVNPDDRTTYDIPAQQQQQRAVFSPSSRECGQGPAIHATLKYDGFILKDGGTPRPILPALDRSR